MVRVRAVVVAGWVAAGCGAGAGGFDPAAPVRGREGASSGAMSEVGASVVTTVDTPSPVRPVYSTPAAAMARTAPSRTVVPVVLGQTVRGRFEPGDAQLESGSYVDEYAFVGSAGDAVTVELHGDQPSGGHLDVYLYLLLDGRTVAQDDDSAGNLDSRVALHLPATGAYVIRASTFGGSPRPGEYTLVLRAGAEAGAE